MTSFFVALDGRCARCRAYRGRKYLALLHELVPGATTVALLVNPNNAEAARQPADLQEAARTIGLQLMRDLAQDADGEFSVRSAPGRGTRICLEVPVP